MNKKSKNLYNVDGLLTCPTCNFALVALAHAVDLAAKNKTTNALARHLAVVHQLTTAEIAERLAAAEVLTHAA